MGAVHIIITLRFSQMTVLDNAVVKQIQQASGEEGAVYGDVSQPPQVEKMFTRKACAFSPSPRCDLHADQRRQAG
jgi:hypothetical protein